MLKREYLIAANTFAAPFFSDEIREYIVAENEDVALGIFLGKHENRIYAANVYDSGDDYIKGNKPIAKYRSPKALKDYGEK